MNLFRNLFISALFYLLYLYPTVVCRISDKRKCADADCSEPISLATTLIRYNADDDRLLSFPRNVKLKVFSKEAGDTPNFWEVEDEVSNTCVNFQGSRKHFLDLCDEVIYGKRGYVPKGLLREDKVLVPQNKLTHIVPTGRIDTLKQNATNANLEEPESNSVKLLSATPELPVANSKGLFSTIGGVSADSVPMNSPDIKPQSTRKFQVFDGTTLYDDVVSEKPESPPTVIADTGNENQESDKKPLDSKEVPHDYNVPSSDIKPVNEETDENKQEIASEQEIIEVNKQTEKEEDLNKITEDKSNQPEESQRETNFFGDFVNTVTNLISSGAGEGITEEELEEEEEEEEDGDDEGSAEEAGYDEEEEEEEGKSKTENLFKRTTGKESEGQPQPEKVERQPLETLHTNTSEAPNLVNIIDENFSGLKPDDALKSGEHDRTNQKDEELSDKNKYVEGSEKVTEKSMNSSSDIKTNVEAEIKVDGQENPTSVSEQKEELLSKPSEVDTFESKSIQGSDLLKGNFIQPKESDIIKSGSDHVYEEFHQQDTKEDLKKITDEVKTDSKPAEKENTLEPTGYQSDEAFESQVKSDSAESKIKEKLKSSALHVQEQLKTDEPQDQEQPITVESQVQGESKGDESQDQGEPKTDESQVQGDPKTVESQVQGESKTDESQVQGEPKTDESQVQGDPKTVESQVQGEPKTDEPQVQGEPTTDESKVQGESTTDESQVQGKPKTDELQVQEEPKTGESQDQEHPEIATQSPPLQPTARQFLFGSGQINGGSHEENKYETPPSPEPQDDLTSLNDTAQVKLAPPHPTHSSLPTMQSVQSPKYSSVISRRIQSSGSSSVNEILSHSEVEEELEPQLDNTVVTSGSTPIDEHQPNLLLQSQSPKYSSVVSSRIGSVTPSDYVKSEATPETAAEAQAVDAEAGDVTATEEQSSDTSTVETVSQAEVKPIAEIESKDDIVIENNEVPLQDSHPSTPSDEVAPAEVVDETSEETAPEEGMFSWVTSFFEVFGTKDLRSTGESPIISENLDSSRMTHFADETCSADGAEGSCPTLRDNMQQEVTWQEASHTSDMWELLDKLPLEATIWLVITAVVVLIFSLGHYYIEAHRRDGPLVAIINKLEREVLILKKERCIMEDRLHLAEQQLEAWNTSSTENDALLVELKQELEETKAAKAELEEQAGQLKEELETVTESGLEMHRLLEESLSSQDGSQVLLSTVETLREKLQRQEEEISGLSDTLASKDTEVEDLHGKLAQAAEVARSLEDKVISVTREKEEELLQLRDKHRELISQLEEVMETKALDETRLSTEMSKLRLAFEELQKTLAEKDSELDTLKEVVKQLRSTDSNEKMDALFDVVGVQAKLKTAAAERDDFREKFLEEEGARKLLEGHMKKITLEVTELKNSFETAEKEKIEALTKLQVLSNYFKEKESQLQKELGMQESMWLQKQSDDHSIYEQMRSLREENEKYKLQNESLKKEIVEQEASFKIQLANTEQKAHENWVASRQAERRLKEAQQESAQLRNRLTTVEKNSANYSLDEKPNISESNGDPSSPPPSLMFPPTTSPPFMMYGPPIPPPGDFVPPPPFMGSPYPSDSRPPPLGRISSPPLDHRFSPPPPLPYPPYDYPSYGHHSPSPPPPMPSHHRNVHKPQPREMSREQKDHVPNYSPETEKTSRRNKR